MGDRMGYGTGAGAEWGDEVGKMTGKWSGNLRSVNIPIPNPGLGEWLIGPQCREIVKAVTESIWVIYENTLPASRFDPDIPGSGERNLKRGANWDVNIGGFGHSDRWVGYVYNTALSYKKQKGQPYPRAIEYGNPARNTPGQHQLRDAANAVGANIGVPGSAVNIPGVTRVPEGRGSKTRGGRGRFIANPLESAAAVRSRPKRRIK
jgi:hypothetical protein